MTCFLLVELEAAPRFDTCADAPSFVRTFLIDEVEEIDEREVPTLLEKLPLLLRTEEEEEEGRIVLLLFVPPVVVDVFCTFAYGFRITADLDVAVAVIFPSLWF